MVKQPLDGLWKMRCTKDNDWIPAKVPGSVIAALLDNQKIKDPFYRTNEYAVRDLFYNDYEFSREFCVEPSMLEHTCIELVCQGLDTLATLYLNDAFFANTDNMHRTWRFNIKPFLHAGTNTLRIVFASPLEYIAHAHAQSEDRTTYTATGCIEGNGFLRKSHCMFGWDWGPQLPDAGIWRSIGIEAFSDAKLDDVLLGQQHTEAGVIVSCKVALQQLDDADYTVRMEITAPNGMRTATACIADKQNTYLECNIASPQLWWPNGLGEQPLYSVVVTLLREGIVCDTYDVRIGLRTMEVSTQADEWGNEFCFCVNGKKIFAMGADYVPEDSILTRVTRDTTEKLIQTCVKSNFNCIRVWGGANYPSDDFYDLCDEYGLIIWQDLMFACNVYVMSQAFEENIVAEVRDNVKRIRHHASLGLWCGNNEMELGWVEWDRVRYHSDKLRADYIKQFEYVLPKVVREVDPYTFYWRASPSSTGCFDNPNDENRGDVHYWEVWHELKPFTEFRKYHFRFCSEFGFQAFPTQKTVDSYTEKQDRNIFSKTMESHQKHGSANGRILFYIADYFKYPSGFENLIYISQVLQAEAIRYGVEHWRRARGRCMGAVYWQLNDCWPVASWASVDYYGRWKALQYAAKKFFAPQMVSAKDEGANITYFAHNETQNSYKGVLEISLCSSDFTCLFTEKTPVFCGALSASELKQYDFSEMCAEYGAENLFARYRLYVNGKIVSEGVNLFVRPKHFEYLPTSYNVTVEDCGEKYAINLQTDVFAHFVELTIQGMDAVFSDNYFSVTDKAGTTVWLYKKDLSREVSAEQLRQAISVRSVVDSFDI